MMEVLESPDESLALLKCRFRRGVYSRVLIYNSSTFQIGVSAIQLPLPSLLRSLLLVVRVSFL